ncbi:MAG: hypothetical protein HW407_840 [Bacteroidetes bacterium]|nr:hypothetical protein [Bacteroidota bacterium]
MHAQPLNILQTCFSHSWGGLEIQALEVTKQLSNSGHAVCLACCSTSRLALEAEKNDLAILPLDVTGYVHPRIVWQLGRIIARHRIDIIHCQLSKDIATVVPALTLFRRRIPLLLSKRVGSYISKKDMFHRFTYNRVDRVLAISEVIHKNVLDTTPITPDRVLTLHDAIDTNVFSLQQADRQKVRNELGLSNDIVLIGFVGRFSPGKGHEELLEAARIISQKDENVHFLIVGEASHGEQRYEQKIMSLSRSLGIEKTVTFAGFREDIPDVMAAFDIFAFPSHAESFGVVLIEAMAMERPVVSTNCDGVLDIVVDGETGLYVQPRRADELAVALMQLIADPLLRDQMGKAGRKRVEDLFDQRKQISTLEDIYEELLSTK